MQEYFETESIENSIEEEIEENIKVKSTENIIEEDIEDKSIHGSIIALFKF